MPRFHVVLESHKLNNKYLIYSYNIKEKTGVFNGITYKTFNYLDMMKWDGIQSYFRNKFLRVKGSVIKSFDATETQEVETKARVDNLALSIKIKPITSALLDVMDIKAPNSYGCYIEISIEEVVYDSKLTRIDSLQTPNKGERTPMKDRSDTPRPKSRRVTRRQITEENDDTEYNPCNNNDPKTVLEYVPSSQDEMMAELEYVPKSANGTDEFYVPEYTPSVTKRRKQQSSLSDDPTPKKNKIDVISLESSQESLAETLDRVSITGKNSSNQELFGYDSEGESKKVKESSLDELEKKFYEKDPPPVKYTPVRQTGGGPGPSRSAFNKPSSKLKSKQPKKGELPLMQRNIETWINTDRNKSKDNNIEVFVSKKSRSQLEQEAQIAANCASMQQRKQRINAELEQIEQTNVALDEQLLRQRKELYKYREKLLFPSFTQEQLENAFKTYRTDLTKLFKSVTKHQKLQPSNLARTAPRFVRAEILDYMNEILQNNLTRSVKHEFHNCSHDSSHFRTDSARVNGAWSLPNFVCDFYIAMDVICSTSSIFNLVAISIDRYIAVTQPIKYAKHKNSRRVCLTILLVWAISAAIGSPIVLGLNNTPDRLPDLCLFYNSDFIVYSSLSSFYIPCIIMIFLYWSIFKALRIRAAKQRAARKPHLSDITAGGSIIENITVNKKLAETTLDGSSKSGSKVVPDEQPTNTASGSNEEDDDNAGSPDVDDCPVIINDKSTEFMLATVVEEAGNVMTQITTQHHLSADPNGNHDSGYVPSNVTDVNDILVVSNSPPGSPQNKATIIVNKNATNRRNGSPRKDNSNIALKPISSLVRSGVNSAFSLSRNDSTLSTNSRDSRKDKKNVQASRFTIYKVNKASKKKREKSSAKKERKATKTLAIVLGVFLICWVPFFTCNIMDAMCTKLDMECQPGVTAFILTTWLGYMNSFVNPIIYTIFNPEFRKAFKKIMHLDS